MLIGLTLAEDIEDNTIWTKVGSTDTGLINILKGNDSYFILLCTDKGQTCVVNPSLSLILHENTLKTSPGYVFMPPNCSKASIVELTEFMDTICGFILYPHEEKDVYIVQFGKIWK